MKVATKATSKQDAKPSLIFLLPALLSGVTGVGIIVRQWSGLTFIERAQFYTPYPGEIEDRLRILLLGYLLASACLVFASYYLYRWFHSRK